MKLIILDRDGVINEDSDDYIKSVDEWQALPGSIEAIAKLSRAGWHVAVATNQSGVARGLFSMQTLNDMHAKMHRLVQAAGGTIDAVFMCTHAPDAGCNCRKPAPGMIQAIAQRFDIALDQVPIVGDTVRDLQAGASQGCVPYLVLTGKGNAAFKSGDYPAGTKVRANLLAVAQELLSQNKPAPTQPGRWM